MKCPYCGEEVLLKSSKDVYHDEKYYGNMWVCSNFPECDSYVGCHKGTTIPLGRLANKRLRTLKKEAHRQFDPIWKSGLMSRAKAYQWLADMLHVPLEECHIGMFDIKQCQKAIYLCKEQNNEVINHFRDKEYGHTKNRTFTRGYASKKKH